MCKGLLALFLFLAATAQANWVGLYQASLTDSSGAGNNLTDVNGNVNISTLQGLPCFNGFDGTHILRANAGACSAMANSATWVIEMKVWSLGTPGDPPYYGLSGVNGLGQFLWGYPSTTEIYNAMGTGTAYNSVGANLAVGAWTIVTIDDSGLLSHIYVGGVQKGISVNQDGFQPVDTISHFLGFGCNDGQGANSFNGYINYIAMKNDAPGTYPLTFPTATNTPTQTSTPTTGNTNTFTASPTKTSTPTISATSTPTPTNTPSPTVTPTDQPRWGMRGIYYASYPQGVSITAPAQDAWVIQGNDNYDIAILRFTIGQQANVGGCCTDAYLLVRRNSANSGGAKSFMEVKSMDSDSPPSISHPIYYTNGNPPTSLGNEVGKIGVLQWFDGNNSIIFNKFRIIAWLKGSSDYIAYNMSTGDQPNGTQNGFYFAEFAKH